MDSFIRERVMISEMAEAKQKTDDSKMTTFLIKLPHTQEECLKAIDEVKASKPELLNKIEWGCMDNDHCGYLTVKAKGKDEALDQLTQTEQKNAQVVKVSKFSAKQIEDFHKTH